MQKAPLGSLSQPPKEEYGSVTKGICCSFKGPRTYTVVHNCFLPLVPGDLIISSDLTYACMHAHVCMCVHVCGRGQHQVMSLRYCPASFLKWGLSLAQKLLRRLDLAIEPWELQGCDRHIQLV